MSAGILRLGAYVPPVVVGNEQVAGWIGESPEWIVARTGIVERRHAPAGVCSSDLALPAAREAMGGAEGARERIGALLVATSTPDQPQPSTAVFLQAKLGLGGPAFGLEAACAGFLHSLVVADVLLAARPELGEVLVVGVDTLSRVMDRGDRRTASLFGDAAGAAVVGAVPDGYGIRSWQLVSHGEHAGYVTIPAGGSRLPTDAATVAAGQHLIRMDGRAVREYIYQELPKLVDQTLAQAGFGIDEVDRVVFHQANPKLIAECAALLGVDPARCPITGDRYGNTGAASVPITLHAAHGERPLRRDERLLLLAIGAGMTCASVAMVWH
jgi:3-oxoacyl-[acyl-carrier-protein] synthase-3